MRVLALFLQMQEEAPVPEGEDTEGVVVADAGDDEVPLADHEVSVKQLVPAHPEGTSMVGPQEHPLQKEVKQFCKFVPMSHDATFEKHAFAGLFGGKGEHRKVMCGQGSS